MEKIAGKLADQLVLQEIVKKDDRDFYQYAIESLFIYIVNAAVMMVLAFSLGKVYECGAFLFFFYPLRTYCGGIHLKKWYTCCAASCCIICLIVIGAGLIIVNWMVLIFSVIVCEICVWKKAPCSHVNHPLDSGQQRQFRHKARIYNAVIWGTVIVLKGMGMEVLVMLGWSAEVLNVVLMMGGGRDIKR